LKFLGKLGEGRDVRVVVVLVVVVVVMVIGYLVN